MFPVFCFAAFSLMAGSALAQQPPAKPAGWNITVGAAPVVSPVFMGSDDYALSVFPDLRVAYGDDFFASIPEGMGYNVINAEGFKAGPIARIRFSRSESDGGSPFLVTGESNALRGLGDVDSAGEVGGFVQYTAGSLRARGEVRQGFGGHDGWLADASLAYVGQEGQVRYNMGPRMTFGGEDFINTYYGVDAVQSARSGLPTYRSNGGLVSYGVGGTAIYPVSDNISATLFGGYDRLGESIADAPLVRFRGSPNQFTMGMGVAYRFNAGM